MNQFTNASGLISDVLPAPLAPTTAMAVASRWPAGEMASQPRALAFRVRAKLTSVRSLKLRKFLKAKEWSMAGDAKRGKSCP